MNKNIRAMREIPPEWDRLMQVAQKIGRGRAEIIFNEGRPVQIEVIVQKVMLDRPDEFEEKFKVIGLL